MDLLVMKEILDEKESEKNKFIGKNEIFIENLKEIGYKSIKLATTALNKMITDHDKKKTIHIKKVAAFTKKYKELL